MVVNGNSLILIQFNVISFSLLHATANETCNIFLIRSFKFFRPIDGIQFFIICRNFLPSFTVGDCFTKFVFLLFNIVLIIFLKL